MKTLLRHYGFRRIAAHLGGLALGIASYIVFQFLPHSDRPWTDSEVYAYLEFEDGITKLAFVAWLYVFIRPWIAKQDWLGKTAQFVMLAASPLAIWGLFECSRAGLVACRMPGDSVAAVGRELLTMIAVPIIALWLPQAWLEVNEHLKATPFLRRWFVSHQGHIASWIGVVQLRRFIHPLPSKPDNKAGHFGKGLFAGRTLFEDDGIGGQEVFIEDNSHGVVVGCTGGGKHISHEAHLAILHPGSGVFISPKPSLADLTLARRVDPRVFSEERFPLKKCGINPAGISRCRYHLPNGRAFVLGTDQSVYPACRYDFLSDIDFTKENARTFIMAVGRGSLPDRSKNCSTDPWFTITPRTLFASVFGFIGLTDPDPTHRTLPWIVERALGIDPATGIASPKYLESLLKQMLECNGMGGRIQAGASNIYNLGVKAFGSVFSEVENSFSWMLDPTWRRQLSGNDFSFHWVGIEGAPVSVYVLPPQGRSAFQESIPWLRSISEMSLEILASKAKLPQTPTLFVGDEYPQWGQEISAVRQGFAILRSSKIKLQLYVQSYSQLVEMFGEHGAAEIESSSSMTYFGVNDLPTAERISRRLGKQMVENRRLGMQANDLITPAEVMTQLRLTSPLAYVFPPGAAPMRLERVAFKPLRLNDGSRYNGLSLEGHYDDGLTRESFYGIRS